MSLQQSSKALLGGGIKSVRHCLRSCSAVRIIVVQIVSIGGLKMAPGFGAYGPSKAGVIALTRTAAMEHAKNGIRVNVVCPGPTTGTQLMANTMAADPNEEENLKAHVIPMGKLGTAEDVAHAVVWLCSDYAGHTTGQAFSVDGGMHMA